MNHGRGEWGDGVESVSMMNALVPGAEDTEDCVMAGWTEWLAGLCTYLYKSNVGADDEQRAAVQWAYRVIGVEAQRLCPLKCQGKMSSR